MGPRAGEDCKGGRQSVVARVRCQSGGFLSSEPEVFTLEFRTPLAGLAIFLPVPSCTFPLAMGSIHFRHTTLRRR